MTPEWRMFSAVISKRRDPDNFYQESTIRLHLMLDKKSHVSLGFVEQRYLNPITHNEPQVHYYVTCIAHEHSDPILVNTLEDGMNLLTLMINRGEHHAN